MLGRFTMRKFWKFILWIINWKVVGDIPRGLNKYVIAVAPHTSNWDFILGVIVRGAKGFHSNYLAKESLFKPPFGYIFRMLGGIPVDRKNRHNMVDQVVDEALKRTKFGLAVTPEGTRKKVDKWKTGFYYIADKAGIPVIPALLDWEKREVRLLDPIYTTGNIDRDLPLIKSKFEDIKGAADLN